MSQQRTAVLTGAAGTIGVATARRLIDGGARVYGIDIDARALDAAAARLGDGLRPGGGRPRLRGRDRGLLRRPAADGRDPWGSSSTTWES